MYNVQFVRAPTPKLLVSNSGPVRGIISKAALSHGRRFHYQPLFEKGACSPPRKDCRLNLSEQWKFSLLRQLLLITSPVMQGLYLRARLQFQWISGQNGLKILCGLIHGHMGSNLRAGYLLAKIKLCNAQCLSVKIWIQMHSKIMKNKSIYNSHI